VVDVQKSKSRSATVVYMCMAPVVSTCGADVTVPAGFCASLLESPTPPPGYVGVTVQPEAAQIPTFCNERGATLPKCRLASRAEVATASGVAPDFGFPQLVQSGCDGSCPIW
jgi:hypothetical protein